MLIRGVFSGIDAQNSGCRTTAIEMFDSASQTPEVRVGTESQIGIGQEARSHARAIARSEQREARIQELGFESYSDYLASKAWHEVKVRYRRTIRGAWCQICRSEDELHLHHKTYDRVGEELASDLVLLCGDCHAAVHDLEKQSKLSLGLKVIGTTGEPEHLIRAQREQNKAAARARAISYLRDDPVRKRRNGERLEEHHLDKLPAADDLKSHWDIGSRVR